MNSEIRSAYLSFIALFYQTRWHYRREKGVTNYLLVYPSYLTADQERSVERLSG